VRRLQQQGIGVVFISHRIHELKAICDTLTVLRDGKLIESGPMADLSGEADRREDARPRAERYLSAARRRTAKKRCCGLKGCTTTRC
jgi:ABC-type sugar transport system ATPase subunit